MSDTKLRQALKRYCEELERGEGFWAQVKFKRVVLPAALGVGLAFLGGCDPTPIPLPYAGDFGGPWPDYRTDLPVDRGADRSTHDAGIDGRTRDGRTADGRPPGELGHRDGEADSSKRDGHKD